MMAYCNCSTYKDETDGHLRLLRKNQLGLQSMNFFSNMKKNDVRKKTKKKEGGNKGRMGRKEGGKEDRKEGKHTGRQALSC